MNDTRQDAWTNNEDIILAETVLRYIREGKTQLEAFKEVSYQLSRTPAACGFRWNATIRKQYHEAIEHAKEERKNGSKKDVSTANTGETDTIETAILLLEKMKENFQTEDNFTKEKHEEIVTQLENENRQLKEYLKRYEETFIQFGKIISEVNTFKNNKI
ncbi:RsfA family transcriptional regulator [Oceanobacillus sp. Castelsardo]|uniref:RsfA family transcriptional regulator n=1 Tax=Oceanobacillus sp. Castelsardo TaxID=1851204 RepID=UPI00083844FE|nr:RsfA family transcriptional regulator [Oceanobacillus sp. Castelsardo]